MHEHLVVVKYSIFNKGTENLQEQEDCQCNRWCWEACGRLNLDPRVSPCIKSKSKWTKELSIKTEALNLLEGKTGETLEVISIVKDCLNRTPVGQETVPRIKHGILSK